MLRNDSETTAGKAARIFTDARVRQFHDPRRRAGAALAKGLLRNGAGPAWDVYLFYPKASRWSDDPPAPAHWVHQLAGGRRADRSRFRTGQKLVTELHRAMKKLLTAQR